MQRKLPLNIWSGEARALQAIDEKIAQEVKKAVDGGDLRGAASYGKPFPDDRAHDATPEALRMPFKILKDAGFIPAEVALFRERARLREELDACVDADRRAALQEQINAISQKLAIRLETLRDQSRL